MTLSPSEAAKTTGRSKSTIIRAIQSGRISADKDTRGIWRIEPAELHRAYPPVSNAPERDAMIGTSRTGEPVQRIETLEAELRAAREQVSDLLDQRERLRESETAWRAMATQKRLTWRGLFGGGKAE